MFAHTWPDKEQKRLEECEHIIGARSDRIRTTSAQHTSWTEGTDAVVTRRQSLSPIGLTGIAIEPRQLQ